MTPDDIAALFTRPDGSYGFARWSRPIAPVVFGASDATIAAIKAALTQVTELAAHPLAETDPEQGANLMIFLVRDWSELRDLPGLDGLVPGLAALIPRLDHDGAVQYRHVRTEADGAIRACFVFVRIAGGMAELAADDLALALAVQVILVWGDGAFRDRSPLVQSDGGAVIRPVIAALIRAAYDPVLPNATGDASHALRVAARSAITEGY